MPAPDDSKLNTEIISSVLGLITALTGLLIAIPTFEEAFNTTLIKYLLPLVSGIIVTVMLFAILKKFTRGWANETNNANNRLY